MNFTTSTLISSMMDFLFIIVFSFIGAVVKDTYNTMTDKDKKVKITRILISTLVSSIVLFSLSEILIEKLSIRQFVLPCFVGGMIGFEALGKIKNLSFWIKVFQNNKNLLKSLEEEKKEENT